MNRLLMPLALAVAFALALPASSSLAQGEPDPFTADIVRNGDDWRATFTVPGDAPIWAFTRSALQRRTETPWRPDSWQVLTPGVTLERIGRFDAFVAANGSMPAQVEIAFTPIAVDLLADYDPAMIFSNGSLALYTGHFSAFPVSNREELEALDTPEGYPDQVTLRDANAQILHRGERFNSATLSGGQYVIFGEVDVADGGDVTTILDPGLPMWLARGIGDFSNTTFAYYSRHLGEHSEDKPVILASWAGPTPETISFGGSVTRNMIAMRLEGVGLLEPVPQALERAEWFVGHEAAHFWMGQTIGYQRRRDMWITEGGADVMALRLMQSQDLTEDSDMHGIVDEARTDCAALLANGGIYTAADRLEHRANYACGLIFALAVEQAGAARGEDVFDFLNLLITRHRGERIDTDDWLAAARDFGLPQSKAQLIRNLLANGAQDAETAITTLLPADS